VLLSTAAFRSNSSPARPAGHAQTSAKQCSVFLKRLFAELADGREAGASFRMPVHSISEPGSAADCPAAEQRLLTIGRSGVLSSRVIAAGEFETLLRLLGPPSERQRSDLRRATDIVLVEHDVMIYWPRTGELFRLADAGYAMARVQATLA
jgi:hypothetical protein